MKSIIKTTSAYLFMFSLLIKSYPQRLLCVPIYVIFSALLPFVPIVFPAMIIDDIVAGRDFETIVLLIVSMCVCGFIMEFIIELIDEYDVVWDACFAFETTGVILKKYMELDMADIETKEVYDKYNLANVALEKGIGYFLDSIKELSIKIIELVTASFIIASIHPVLIVIMIAFTVLMSSIQKRSLKEERMFDENIIGVNRKYRYLYNTINDFQYGKEIRVYSLREKLLERIDGLNNEYLLKYKNIRRIVNCLQSSNLVINLFVNAIIYMYMIFQFVLQRITLGSFTIILGAIERFKNSMIAINECLTKMNDMGLRIRDLQDYLAIESKLEGTKKEDVDIKSLSNYDIRFENVCFRYPNTEQMVLKNVDITIPYGEKLTIVGENGAGKSTFIKLLFRIYDPTEGNIYLGNQNIKDFSLKEYHDLLAAVFQDYRMLSFTIRDNIVFGHSAYAHDNSIYEILKMLEMDEKIKRLPNGLDTYLNRDYEEDGVQFSGGELQKLAIARAIYRKSYIYVVDEPTSALDAIAEAEMYNVFRNAIGEKTGIFISHRMSSARFGEKIALFEGGKIVEYGTFEEVMGMKGRFCELYHLQAQYYVDNEEKYGYE